MEEFSFSEYHMGTTVSISLIVSDLSAATTIAEDLFGKLHEAELRFSRFLPQSELSKLNHCGRAHVSSEFISVLDESRKLSKMTHGAFNPLVQVAQLGYTTSFRELPKKGEVGTWSYNTRLEDMIINRKTSEVALAKDQQLDFGGFLKGYIATRLVAYVRSTYPDCSGIIINLGGDIATWGHDVAHEPFIFFIYNPLSGEEIPLAITDAALATSGTYKRRWDTNAGEFNHIVHTATQKNPYTDVISASVIHTDGAVAEAYTKLFLTEGSEGATLVAPPHDYQYILITKTGDVISNIV